MKLLRLTGVLLLFIIGVTAILSLVMPTKQTIKRSVTIHAPASLIYEQLVKLENFNRWSAWNLQDSSIQHTISGKDGTVGAATSWKGDPDISGEGRMEIKSLEENKKVEHNIHFITPTKGEAASAITLDEKNGMTTVSWNFDMQTPRPWNIFNLFSNMDKQLGKNFDEGLAVLKTLVEQKAGTTPKKTYKVEAMNFPATTFVAIRQEIKISDAGPFFQQHFPILFSDAGKANASPGTASALTYKWDEQTGLADVAAAVPVSPGTKIDNRIIDIVDISASKAVFINYTGPYDNLKDAYASLDEYLKEKKLKQKGPSIEQYIYGPVNVKDSSKWLTKIVLLVD